MAQYALGMDYGTNSVRALLVDTDTGAEVATAVYDYLSGQAGILLDSTDPNLARQNPADYLTGFEAVAKAVMQGVDPASVVGIGVDTTGSSPLPVDADYQPLAFQPRYKNDLNAQVWLWKDHTSWAEAAEITERAQDFPYLAKCGGTYSSEWFWSKVLHCARVAPDVFAAAHAWVECADWIPATLCGGGRPAAYSVCAAGHKAMYSDEWGGLPSEEFLASLDPRLAELRSRLYTEAVPSDRVAGRLSEKYAAQTGLRAGIPVAVGAFDAHLGAVAAGVRPGVLAKVIGTSGCDIMVHPLGEELADIPGMCGVVKGSVVPDCYGLEAGQSAVGDLYHWVSQLTGRTHEALTHEASALKPGQSGLLMLDWNNGNRTILVDPLTTGLVVGQSLHTTPGELYRAAIEATAFGSLRIIDRMQEYGVRVDEIVALGGIAEKNPMVMQIYADVLRRPIRLARSGQTCALGAAIYGAVVGGAHPDVASAQRAMAGLKDVVYQPDTDRAYVYARLYRLYLQLHDAFGTIAYCDTLFNVMKDLIAMREAAHA